MSASEIHAVIGAFGYSGKYIARRLLHEKKIVRTLTNSPNRAGEFQGRFDFSKQKTKRLLKRAAAKSKRIAFCSHWGDASYVDPTEAAQRHAPQRNLQIALVANSKRIRYY